MMTGTGTLNHRGLTLVEQSESRVRGALGIGIVNVKHEVNVGTLWRSAWQMVVLHNPSPLEIGRHCLNVYRPRPSDWSTLSECV